MAITPLNLEFGLTVDEVAQAIAAAGLNDQGWSEAFECWDMLQVWQDWVSETFGRITEVRHRSPPDDPPDIELVFEDGRSVGMEHTRLQPQHLGQANAYMRKSGKGGFVPPIWPPPANFDDMKATIAGEKGDSDFIPELLKTFDLLCLTLSKKIQGLPNGGIIGMVHDLDIDCFNQHQMRDMAQDIVNRPEFEGFSNYALILLRRLNHRQYKSLLIRRGQAPLVRNQLNPWSHFPGTANDADR